MCHSPISREFEKVRMMKFDLSIPIDSVVWLYSSNVYNKWWGYDHNSNILLERLYQQFNGHFVNSHTNTNTNTNTTQLPNVQTFNGPSVYNSFQLPISSDMDVDFGHSDNTNNSMPVVLPYIINIGSQTYNIDFDTLVQCSSHDPSKKRTIKRIIIPPNRTNDKINYLLSHDVLGIAGAKF